VLVAMASSGLHSNGYSLVRRVLLQQAGLSLDAHSDELGATLGEVLLTPTRIYAKPVLAMIAACEVHALAHITGGGLAANLVRVLPGGVRAEVDRATWAPAPVFGLVERLGGVCQDDIEAALNMGVGMVAVVPEASVDAARRVLAAASIESWVCGRVEDSPGEPGTVEMIGQHLA